MPKRTDIQKIMLIGSGPIVIGQACEFDYSGTQACKALKEEGYQLVLVNSNPATIMTDPDFADRTYIEPILPEVLEKIIAQERPDALLPTMGGQTALNMAVALTENGVLERYGIRLIGARYEAIRKAENREEFKKAMARIGLKLPESGYARTKDEAAAIADKIGLPAVIRPSFTLGGTGASVAFNVEEFEQAVAWGLAASPVHEVLVEQSVLGWKEFELEVMRDLKDNVVIVCSIENLDPMGIHTGDSITVAPAQTLTDKEYQLMRNASIAIMREIGVDTGGSNIQFAVHPATGEMVVIEMNPRVSRSSALASKATGFPIAKIAAKLAVGFTLDEIQNDITRVTPASFEPSIDYVVVKFPRFAFEKFPQADPTLTTQMKSVGEVMSIGRTFKEALHKAIRSLEVDRYGLERLGEIPGHVRSASGGSGEEVVEVQELDLDQIKEKIRIPNWERVWYIADAFRRGIDVETISGLSRIDPWFLHQIREIVDFENQLIARSYDMSNDLLRQAKEYGFSDRRLAQLMGIHEEEIRRRRKEKGITPTYKRVDTCAGEFLAHTPYLYSTYERECEAHPTRRQKIVILGSGPNRIGQGIEFDYCCVHAAFAAKEEGYETIMVNCNPETVSTDYDTSDRLYFEPLTEEDVLNIIDIEKPDGIVVQFGGQTPLKLAVPLERVGVRILGTLPEAIDLAEDRGRFRALLDRLGLKQPQSDITRTIEEAVLIAGALTYPVLVRPSYVLGGRAMEILYDEVSLRKYVQWALLESPQHPILIDKYLEDAIELDVDAVSDGEDVIIGGILEHIEEAGVHSGDSACSLPPFSLTGSVLEEIRRQTVLLAKSLGVVGLMNVQFAVKPASRTGRSDEIFVLEVNPRASRTIPFVSKAIGVPLAKVAMKVMLGRRLRDLGITHERVPSYTAVKEAVFPFQRFKEVDTLLGPEMKSTGEVMGIDAEFGLAFSKAQAGAGGSLPRSGMVFISVKDPDKPQILPIAQKLSDLGFNLLATRGTAQSLEQAGITLKTVQKVKEGRPHAVDYLKNGEIQMVINTVGDKIAQEDSYLLRRTTLNQNIPYFTTIAGARAAVRAIEAILKGRGGVKALQDYHRELQVNDQS
ncbi:MAG: carbamoyl-phosphate synthase large subunit [Nitrospiria bacterium]